MIISHKYRFLFIGLPFSASSAISKELHAKYEGLPYLRKHSLYHEFKKVATINEKKSRQQYRILFHPFHINKAQSCYKHYNNLICLHL